MTVRSSLAGDREAILAVVRDAFATGGRDGQEEVDIVEMTWSLGAGAAGLELVAVDGGQVVGHVLAAYGHLDGREVVGVAPVSVVTARQGEGIGTALMTELIRRADEAGLPLLVVLGEPAYYSRFGFEPSGPLGLSYPPAGANSPYFQVRRLTGYEPAYRVSSPTAGSGPERVTDLVPRPPMFAPRRSWRIGVHRWGCAVVMHLGCR
ncbi:MAG: N-acetyltransferase [Actinomycetota bacterium]